MIAAAAAAAPAAAAVVNILLTYCCQTLKSFSLSDFKISLSSEYQCIVTET